MVSAHCFASNCRFPLLELAEEGNISTKECAGRDGRSRDSLHTKRTRYRPSNRALTHTKVRVWLEYAGVRPLYVSAYYKLKEDEQEGLLELRRSVYQVKKKKIKGNVWLLGDRQYTVSKSDCACEYIGLFQKKRQFPFLIYFSYLKCF